VVRKEFIRWFNRSNVQHGLMKPSHDRMPGDDIMARHWLTWRFGNRPMELNLALQPLPSERMEAHEVGALVNSLKMIRRSAFNLFQSDHQVGRSCLSYSIAPMASVSRTAGTSHFRWKVNPGLKTETNGWNDTSKYGFGFYYNSDGVWCRVGPRQHLDLAS
jgi:hypothetical protein